MDRAAHVQQPRWVDGAEYIITVRLHDVCRMQDGVLDQRSMALRLHVQTRPMVQRRPTRLFSGAYALARDVDKK